MDRPERRAFESAVDSYYRERLHAGVFCIPRCKDCGELHFYPRVACPHCHSSALVWTTPSGRGVVYSTTVVRRRNSKHNVALIDLEEGPRLMSRVVDIEPERISIGMPVQAEIRRLDTEPLLVFSPRKPAGKGGAA